MRTQKLKFFYIQMWNFSCFVFFSGALNSFVHNNYARIAVKQMFTPCCSSQNKRIKHGHFLFIKFSNRFVQAFRSSYLNFFLLKMTATGSLLKCMNFLSSHKQGCKCNCLKCNRLVIHRKNEVILNLLYIFNRFKKFNFHIHMSFLYRF